jgi:hypothetical protein
LKDEFRGVAQQIAEGIGELVGVAPNNSDQVDPRFCLLIPSRLRWEQSVIVENSLTQIEVEILIDYDNLRLRCKYCAATIHCIRDYPSRPGARQQNQ